MKPGWDASELLHNHYQRFLDEVQERWLDAAEAVADSSPVCCLSVWQRLGVVERGGLDVPEFEQLVEADVAKHGMPSDWVPVSSALATRPLRALPSSSPCR